MEVSQVKIEKEEPTLIGMFEANVSLEDLSGK
jgi:hypothetical protein